MSAQEQQAVAIIDCGYGDSGKGHLTQKCAVQYGAHTVVRISGAHNAGHNIHTPDRRHHTFAHIGSASFIPGVATHLSRYMLVSPMALVAEARVLAAKGVTDIWGRITVSERALTITPFQRAANRLREVARGLAAGGRHGSCGFGVGETVSDDLRLPDLSIFVRDCLDKASLLTKMVRMQEHKRVELAEVVRLLKDSGAVSDDVRGEIDWLEDSEWPAVTAAHIADDIMPLLSVTDDTWEKELYRRPGAIVFEGAQGVLLDQWRGFHPHTTWSRCCNANAYALLDEYGYGGKRWTLGVTRAYATRHGAGPFVTQNDELTRLLPDSHNVQGDWQQDFRVGWLDFVALRYAIAASAHKIDALAVTCLDRLADAVTGDWRYCNHYIVDGVSDSKADQLFAPDDLIDGCAKDINLGLHKDLAYQERLTNALKQARPFLGYFSGSELNREARFSRFADFTARMTGVPVKFLSQGPTIDDIRELP